MDGFKDTTRMKYMMGGDVKAYKSGGAMKPVNEDKNPGLSKLPTDVRNKMGYMKKGGPAKMAEGGTYNEKGKRATLAEMEAEDRRMGSSMPAKKAVGPSSVAVSKVLAGMAKKAGARGMGAMSDREMQMVREAAKKAVPASGIGGGALAGAAAGALAGAGARAGARAAAKAVPRGMGAMSDREMQMVREAAKKAVPSYSDRPMIRRKTGGLSVMPKGKC